MGNFINFPINNNSKNDSMSACGDASSVLSVINVLEVDAPYPDVYCLDRAEIMRGALGLCLDVDDLIFLSKRTPSELYRTYMAAHDDMARVVAHASELSRSLPALSSLIYFKDKLFAHRFYIDEVVTAHVSGAGSDENRTYPASNMRNFYSATNVWRKLIDRESDPSRRQSFVSHATKFISRQYLRFYYIKIYCSLCFMYLDSNILDEIRINFMSTLRHLRDDIDGWYLDSVIVPGADAYRASEYCDRDSCDEYFDIVNDIGAESFIDSPASTGSLRSVGNLPIVESLSDLVCRRVISADEAPVLCGITHKNWNSVLMTVSEMFSFSISMAKDHSKYFNMAFILDDVGLFDDWDAVLSVLDENDDEFEKRTRPTGDIQRYANLQESRERVIDEHGATRFGRSLMLEYSIAFRRQVAWCVEIKRYLCDVYYEMNVRDRASIYIDQLSFEIASLESVFDGEQYLTPSFDEYSHKLGRLRSKLEEISAAIESGNEVLLSDLICDQDYIVFSAFDRARL